MSLCSSTASGDNLVPASFSSFFRASPQRKPIACMLETWRAACSLVDFTAEEDELKASFICKTHSCVQSGSKALTSSCWIVHQARSLGSAVQNGDRSALANALLSLWWSWNRQIQAMPVIELYCLTEADVFDLFAISWSRSSSSFRSLVPRRRPFNYNNVSKRSGCRM